MSDYAKGMKQGQNPQNPVLRGGPQHLGDAFNIGIDVGMGQHDAFGLPRTSAAEDHGRHVIRPGTLPANASLWTLEYAKTDAHERLLHELRFAHPARIVGPRRHPPA